jgi:psp operon transcriptional activator
MANFRETSEATPIGEAPAFQAMLAQVSRVAPLDRPVLVVGERGTGKELVASRIALLSGRWDRPFLKLNCAALAETLLDSELFGHEAGAFTGAARRRASRFELADRGTLFLDEIAQASLAVQEKILRVSEYGTFERVGGNEVHHVDVRLVAATHADLPSLVEQGKFRADLLDRLAFDVITVPPLRARAADIPRLATYFAVRMTTELGGDYFAGFAPAALDVLLRHAWPGNVRELRNAVERSVARAGQPSRPLREIILDPFESPYRPESPNRPSPAASPATPHPAAPVRPDPSGPIDFTAETRAFEARLLRAALERSQFNQKDAAHQLGLTYHQLRHHLKTHRLGGRPPRAPAAPDGGAG